MGREFSEVIVVSELEPVTSGFRVTSLPQAAYINDSALASIISLPFVCAIEIGLPSIHLHLELTQFTKL